MPFNLALFRKHVQDNSPAFVPLFVDQSRYQVAWGGAGSGKSHIVARKILYRLLSETNCKHNFLVIRKVDRTIKRSVFALLKNIISIWGLLPEFDINLTDKTMIYRPTGSQIMFSGLDDVEKDLFPALGDTLLFYDAGGPPIFGLIPDAVCSLSLKEEAKVISVIKLINSRGI